MQSPTHPDAEATPAELAELAAAVAHNCACPSHPPGRRCAAHGLLDDPAVVAGLLRARRGSGRLRRAELDGAGTARPGWRETVMVTIVVVATMAGPLLVLALAMGAALGVGIAHGPTSVGVPGIWLLDPALAPEWSTGLPAPPVP